MPGITPRINRRTTARRWPAVCSLRTFWPNARKDQPRGLVFQSHLVASNAPSGRGPLAP